MKRASRAQSGAPSTLTRLFAAALRTTWQTGAAIAVNLAVCYSAARAVPSLESFVLVRDGAAAATILVDSEPTPTARLAAKELQYCVGQITGARIPISSNLADATGVRIAVGDIAMRLADSNGAWTTPAEGGSAWHVSRSDDAASLEYHIRFLPGVIAIFGQDATICSGAEIDYASATGQHTANPVRLRIPGMFDDQGTLRAAYDFLERFCRVRFYGPKSVSVVFPKQSTLSIIPTDIDRRPAIPHASGSLTWGWPIMNGQYGNPSEDALRLYERRIRLGGIPWYTNHTLHNYPRRFPKSRYPEFYAAGKSRQLCYSSEALVRQVAQDAQNYFDGAEVPGLTLPRGSRYYPVVPEDAARYCQCGQCRRSLEPHKNDVALSPDGSKLFNDGRASHLWFRFVNNVAKQIATTHPDKFISTLAYENYFWRPRGVKLEPNIAVAPCLAIRNHWHLAYRQNELSQYALWAAEERPLFLWNYYCFPEEPSVINNWRCFPGFTAHYLEGMIQRYAKDGVKGVFLCGIGEQVDFYVTMKLYDDPSQSVDQLLDEFFELYFEAAAEPMHQFYTLIEQTYSDPQNWNQKGGFHQTEVMAWRDLGTPERMAQLESLIVEAEAVAVTAAAKERVRLWKEGVWQYMKEGRANYLRPTKDHAK